VKIRLRLVQLVTLLIAHTNTHLPSLHRR